MKHLLLFILTMGSVTCLSQSPNPQLFQTWYLSFVQADDMSSAYIISEIEPPIGPTLTISDQLDFTGSGPCNAFWGILSNVTSDFLEFDMLAQTAMDCEFPSHASVEASYFNLLQSAAQYQIIPQGDGLLLFLSSPLGGSAVFTNFVMNTREFDAGQVAIYPNPVRSTFSLNGAQTIAKVELVNSLGQKLKTIQGDFEKIDISGMAPGIYIIRIYTDAGIINKRLIKDN